MKTFYCANCGAQLEVKIKTVSGEPVRVVAPHDCGEPEDDGVYEAVGQFVQKLNELEDNRKPVRDPDVASEPRKTPTTSTAPPSVRDAIGEALGDSDSPDPREAGSEGDFGDED